MFRSTWPLATSSEHACDDCHIGVGARKPGVIVLSTNRIFEQVKSASNDIQRMYSHLNPALNNSLPNSFNIVFVFHQSRNHQIQQIQQPNTSFWHHSKPYHSYLQWGNSTLPTNLRIPTLKGREFLDSNLLLIGFWNEIQWEKTAGDIFVWVGNFGWWFLGRWNSKNRNCLGMMR